MRKFVVGLIMGFLLATTIGVAASSNIRLIVNGQEITPDVPPQIIDGRVMVPARFIAEPLGATVEWDEKNKIIVITSESKQADIFLNKQNNLYLPGRVIFDILSKKYPNKKISGLGQQNTLWVDGNAVELPSITEKNILYYSIEPLISKDLITLSDIQGN